MIAISANSQMKLYEETCTKCSKLITNRYSTSFSLGIRVLAHRFRDPIYAIYGFVRYADEIVDTFHAYDKSNLLARFRKDTYTAIEEGISLNPVLQAFQQVVHAYQIERELIDGFLRSMEMDLQPKLYSDQLYEDYIYGSAEVVGLMCLRVFCQGDQAQYERLKAPAQSLGKAFQKVNFLRDMKSDFQDRGRVYFPGVDYDRFDNDAKAAIEADILKDFDHALSGIRQLPIGAKMGVYLAYVYYRKLFDKICAASAAEVQERRLRVPDSGKIALLIKSYFWFQLKAI